MRIVVKDNLKELSKNLTRLEKQVIPKATSRALNKVGGTIFTNSKRAIAKSMGVSQKMIKDFIYVSKASYKKPTFVVYFKREHLSLYKLGAVQSAAGVSVKAWGQRQFYKGAFIATMANGKTDVFVRTNDYRGKARSVKAGKNVGKTFKPQLKIHKLFGPTLMTAFNQSRLDEVTRKTVEERLPIEFERAIKSLASRL